MAAYEKLINLSLLNRFLDNIITLIPAKPRKTSITLDTSWSGAGPYTHTVSISGITANSKVDLQPDATVISQMVSDGVQALYVDNNNGTLTAYAVGAAPTAALSIQCTICEVTS